MAQFDAGLEQRFFERERTADREGDEIIAPPFPEIGWLIDQRAVAPPASANARNIVAVGVVFSGFPDAKMSKMQ